MFLLSLILLERLKLGISDAIDDHDQPLGVSPRFNSIERQSPNVLRTSYVATLEG